ncbi:hypothetical protein ACFSJ3_10540 [Corallincola platygyrae]|uniref:Uncharacterized protein n=1 Tax=Corallincola platygyrae TaxID=1193278 RepID=A0ABW4XN83_9GAMM
MKKRKFISVMTMLVALPGLFAPVVLLLGVESIQIAVLAILAFVMRGICGVVGSVMLWKGKRLGYQLATATWVYMVIAALYSLVVLHMNVIPSFELNEVNHVLYLKPLSNGLGKLIWGLPFLYILIRDLTSKAPSGPSNEEPSAEPNGATG